MPDSPATPTIILWFRHDLRLADNPALSAAAAAGAVLPVLVLDEASPGIRPLGGAARWWLHHSIKALGAALQARGLPLLLLRGPADRAIAAVIRQTGARMLCFNRAGDAPGQAQEQAVMQVAAGLGVDSRHFLAHLLVEPTVLRTGAGQPFQVFTPFWRRLAALTLPAPLPVPPGIRPAPLPPGGAMLDDWRLTPHRPDWAAGFAAAWQPGESGALARLTDFLDDGLTDYATLRDRPDHAGTSRLSPHLRFGELSPRQIWHAAHHHQPDRAEPFLRELAWREFSHHLLLARPDLATHPLRPAFAEFPWRPDPALQHAWARGRTGYPLVDAGMRQLWRTGWMHNRVRMVAASFLIKHLLQPWQAGEQWFWDTLVDADPANNAASWQWVAGCGADAAPFFRIFNPQLQGAKFDPDGSYVRRWVPELARLPDRFIHVPWTAAPLELAQAGIRLGRDYPAPLVEHGAARARALAAFASLPGQPPPD